MKPKEAFELKAFFEWVHFFRIQMYEKAVWHGIKGRIFKLRIACVIMTSIGVKQQINISVHIGIFILKFFRKFVIIPGSLLMESVTTMQPKAT